jgi:hypothetical protein
MLEGGGGGVGVSDNGGGVKVNRKASNLISAAQRKQLQAASSSLDKQQHEQGGEEGGEGDRGGGGQGALPQGQQPAKGIRGGKEEANRRQRQGRQRQLQRQRVRYRYVVCDWGMARPAPHLRPPRLPPAEFCAVGQACASTVHGSAHFGGDECGIAAHYWSPERHR